MIVMPTALLWTVVVGLVLHRCYRFLFGRPPNFPKGPPRLPFLGGYGIMLLINYKHLHKAATWLCGYYKSKLIGLRLGKYETVLVNDFDTVKELMNRVDFDVRPDLFMARMREKNFERRGILFTDGPDWKAGGLYYGTCGITDLAGGSTNWKRKRNPRFGR